METRYCHPGWTGTPYASDFEAKWGTVHFDEMLDCRTCASTKDAATKARERGYQYMIAPKESKAGNRLYKVTKQNARCVFQMLDHLHRNAQTCRKKYRGDLEARIYQIVRSARTRASTRNIPFDLDPKDIVRRVKVGYCEATGLPFNLEPGSKNFRSAFTPSLDQKVPSAGYTQENVQVVCLGWNFLKSNFDASEVVAFRDGLTNSRH